MTQDADARDGARQLRSEEFVADPEDPYRNDLLGRGQTVENLHDVTDRDTGPLTAAVFGGFGSGKTAMLRMYAARRRQAHLAVVEFNAARQGYTRDPRRDLLSCLLHELDRSGITQKLRAAIEPAFGRFVEAVTRGVISGSDWAEHPHPAARDWVEMQQLTGQVRSALEAAVNDTPSGKLTVVIDELDRCHPEYALGVMDAARHILDVPGLIVVLGLDPEEMQARVSHLYGAHTNAASYLRRFVDYSIELRLPASGGGLGEFLAKVYTDTGADEGALADPNGYTALMIGRCARDNGFSLRDIQQFVGRVGISLGQADPSPVAVGQILVAFWTLRLGDPKAYAAFVAEQIDAFKAAVTLLRVLGAATPHDHLALRMVAAVAYAGLGARSDVEPDDFVKRLIAADPGLVTQQLADTIAEHHKTVASAAWPPMVNTLAEVADLVDLGAWR